MWKGRQLFPAQTCSYIHSPIPSRSPLINYNFFLRWVYLSEFHFINSFRCLSEFRKESVILILQATVSCPVYDKKRGESLKHLKIHWNLNNLLEFRKKATTSILQMNLHFWWEKKKSCSMSQHLSSSELRAAPSMDQVQTNVLTDCLHFIVKNPSPSIFIASSQFLFKI